MPLDDEVPSSENPQGTSGSSVAESTGTNVSPENTKKVSCGRVEEVDVDEALDRRAGEVQEVRTVKPLYIPTFAERGQHEAMNHILYRSWCRHSGAARAEGQAHTA
eukprot:9276939-Karenia_brevis.AAC.1